MILKIRKNDLYTNAGWFVFSGVSGISYSSKMTGITTSEELADSWLKVVYHEGEEIEKIGARSLTGQGRKVGQHRHFSPDVHKKLGEWIRVVVEFVDGRLEQEWIVQAETYLLNDEGKTIERIF